MTTLIFIVALACFTGANAQSIELGEGTYLQYKGEIGIEGSYFPVDSEVPNQIDRVGLINSSFDLTLQTDFSIDIKIKPRFYYELGDNDVEFSQGQVVGENKTRLYWEDLYLDYYDDNVELRLGYQTWAWKTVESFSQTDILNQTDGQIDFFDAPKYGELGATVRYILPTETEQTLELIYLPYFQSGRQPVGNSRFNPFMGLPFEMNNSSDDAYYGGSNEKWTPQFALKLNSVAFDNTDYSIFGFYGYDKQGVVLAEIDPSLGFPTQVIPNYQMSIKGGLNFQSAIDEWLLKGEFLYHQFIEDSITTARVGNNKIKTATTPSLGITAGLEYTLYSPIFDGHDLGLITEGIYNTDTHLEANETLRFNPFSNHVFLGFRYVFNNSTDRSILLGGFSSLKFYEYLSQLEYEERIFSQFKIKLRAILAWGEDHSPLEKFSSSHRLDGQLTWNF